MKIRIVHTLRADWLYGVRIKTFIAKILRSKDITLPMHAT